MKSWFTVGELIILVAAILLLTSLPLLAVGRVGLWFGAQGLYFIGVSFVVGKYLSRYVRS
ncbi:MAG: hypothetical protein WEC84_03075 [Candidatus Andersenbacteria bacterium]